jgi:hypothetical protein
MPIRVQAVFQGATLLPEDRFINTFHFSDPGPVATETDLALTSGLVAAFFGTEYGSVTVGGLMSRFIVSEWHTQAYDLALPEGEREPTINGFTMPTRSGDNLPEEVAVCLTVRGLPPVTPRRRGRIYIGPLLNQPQVGTFTETSTPTRVNLNASQCIGQVLSAAAAELASNGTYTWCIRSVTPEENFVPIVGGWIDDAFDIQRRRGPDPSTRRIWEAA